MEDRDADRRGYLRRRKRVKKRQEAVDAFDRHSGAVLNLLAEVIFDITEEVEHLRSAEQDQAFCAELHYRLEHGAGFGDPDLVALSGEVLLFVAMAATNVWAGAARRDSSLRSADIAKIQATLRACGGRTAWGMRVRLERQVKALKYRFPSSPRSRT